MKSVDLVYIDNYGILGSNFYWHKYANHGLSKKDILDAGVVDDRVQVHPDMIEELLLVNKELQEHGWCLYIKEGYRSDALYEIVYKRRVEKYGKEATDSLLNLEGRPHALGLSIDAAIWDQKENKEIYLRRGEDGLPALFIGFYEGKEDEESKHYQELQDYLAKLMMKHGFRIGTRLEYFHFDYRPDTVPNYKVSK
jgi:D-alanyl-D-alanine dipeptidase